MTHARAEEKKNSRAVEHEAIDDFDPRTRVVDGSTLYEPSDFGQRSFLTYFFFIILAQAMAVSKAAGHRPKCPTGRGRLEASPIRSFATELSLRSDLHRSVKNFGPKV